MLRLLLAINFLLVSFVAEAQMYIWRDANGVLNYSDRPSPQGLRSLLRKDSRSSQPQPLRSLLSTSGGTTTTTGGGASIPSVTTSTSSGSSGETTTTGGGAPPAPQEIETLVGRSPI